jgi:hypothetical protein
MTAKRIGATLAGVNLIEAQCRLYSERIAQVSVWAKRARRRKDQQEGGRRYKSL